MAIKTELTQADLEGVARAWGLGHLERSRGLPEGSVNTLYVLDTGSGRQVLRLSEGRSDEEITFETELLQHLGANRYPSVHLLKDGDGRLWRRVKERPAVVQGWAPGEHVAGRDLTAEQMGDAGRVLARLHLVSEGFGGTLRNRYAPAQIRAWVEELEAESRRPDRADDPELWAAMPLLARESAALASLPHATEGIIHADWFPDNVRYIGDRVACVLDFEMACNGPYVLDLAIAMHACCWDGEFRAPLVRALFDGYQAERRLSTSERQALWAWSRFSALRFTTTRIRDFHRVQLGADRLLKKDWRRFRDRLAQTVALGPEGLARLCGLDG